MVLPANAVTKRLNKRPVFTGFDGLERVIQRGSQRLSILQNTGQYPGCDQS